MRTASVAYNVSPGVALTPAWDGLGRVLTLTPGSNYTEGQGYMFTITAARDLAGRGLAAPLVLSFTAGASDPTSSHRLYLPLLNR